MNAVSFGWPVALFALLLVPVLPLLAQKSRFGLSRRRIAMVTAARGLAVACAVLALAELRAGLPTSSLAVATIVDTSASVSSDERFALGQGLAPLRAQSGLGVTWLDVAEAGDARVSDLAPAVQTAVAMLPRDRVRRVLLATDGHDGRGDLGASVASARAAGVEVDVLPLGDTPPVDVVSVQALGVPSLVRASERLDVGVTMLATQPTTVTLDVQLDGQPVAHQTATLRRGRGSAVVPVTFPDAEGVHELVVHASAPGDPLAANDTRHALVRVVSPPRVLLVHESQNAAPVLGTVLTDAKLRVELAIPSQVPTDADAMERYALVVLDAIDEETLNDRQQRTLRDWVESGGGGLLTVTSGNGIRREPATLREIEPVMPPPAIPEPRPLELVLVIDRSSSMDGHPMAEARAAGLAGIGALREDALVGVVAFSDGADRVMAPVDAAHRAEVSGFVSTIVAGGGTDIGAALVAAGNILSHDPRYIHHVILLSDGESDPEPALNAARVIAGGGATISAITLGPRNQLMAQIAQIGHGRYHVTQSAGALPALFVHEAQFRQQPATRNVAFTPTIATPSPLLDGTDLSSAPPLNGYALSAAKRGADTILAASPDMPLLAHWFRGLGQVGTFTSGTDDAWADGWRAWPGFRDFWSHVAWKMLRTRTNDPVTLSLDRDPHRADFRTLTVTAPTTSNEPTPVVMLTRTRGGAATSVVLTPRGPGVLSAELPLQQGFVVEARMPWDPEPTAAIGADASFPDEYEAIGADRDALAALAALGGGRVLSSPGEVTAAVHAEAVTRSLRMPLLVLALLAYLASLLLLRLPERRVAAVKSAAKPQSGTGNGVRAEGERKAA